MQQHKTHRPKLSPQLAIAALASLSGLTLNVQGADVTWTGASLFPYWSNNLNWSTNAPPTAADQVVIPASITNSSASQYLMADRTVNSIHFANGTLTKLLADDSTNTTRTLTFAGNGVNASTLSLGGTSASVTTLGGTGGFGALAVAISNAAE